MRETLQRGQRKLKGPQRSLVRPVGRSPSALKIAARKLTNAFRLRGPLADDPTARILHVLLLCLLLWISLELTLAIPFLAVRKTSSALLAGFEAAMLLCSWVLLHRGAIRAASLVYLCATWVVGTVLIAFNGGIRSPGLVFYIALPISAAWLLGFRATLWVTALCLVSSLGMAVLEMLGKSPPIFFPGTPAGIWFTVLFPTIISTVPAAHILRILNVALQELRKHKEHLQELIEQRTGELILARDAAQAANRAKSAFLAKMSHELRTPLSAVLGFSSLLGTERNLTDRQRGDLDIINRSGAHLLELINNLLDVFKIEAGRTVVENAPLDLLNLVREVMGLMSIRAAEKGLNLSCETSSDLPTYIRSDSAKLRQILINLVGNAIKYTEKGSVGVKVNAVKEAERGVLLKIHVEDTGIGIAAQDQERIFDPFVQGGNSKTPSGTGLGLSITRQFLQLMGGTIILESVPSVGSVFRVCLPLQLSEESEIIQRSRSSEQVTRIAPGEPEYRILIVEDESANAFLLQRLLLEAGFRVLVAGNGAEGVEAFREWKPHFVWMDRRMPVMDGMEAVRRIRAMGESGAKIAAISASVIPEERAELLAAGFDDFVSKPFTAEAIFSCMTRHLGVQYLFKDAPASSPTGTQILEPEALATIPEDLRGQLEDAVICLDVKRISRLIDRVSEIAPALGGLLAEDASRYAFTSMLRGLQRSSSTPASKWK